MEDSPLESVEFVMRHILYVLTTATLICGVISWWLMPKFRTYRNFVLLGALSSNIVCFIVFYFFWDFMWRNVAKLQPEKPLPWQWDLSLLAVSNYLVNVRDHWLIVISHMFYLDIVKVFNGQIRRRYLKSVLFCLVAPLVTSSLKGVIFTCFVFQSDEYSIISMIAFYVIDALPATLNSLLYIVTVYSLYRKSNARATTPTNKRRQTYIASLIFILGEGWMFCTYCLLTFGSNSTDFLVIINMYFQPLIMIAFLFVLKSNREIWFEFIDVHKLKDQDIIIQERDVPNPAEQIL